MAHVRRALLSVTDKTGIVNLAAALVAEGVELISTGGTARVLRDNQIPVRDITEITGYPEILDGRLKALHPNIMGAILAVSANSTHANELRRLGIAPIEMIVVNLYQFEKIASKSGVARQELIENVDIGGLTIIRAGAKNFQDVAVVISPDQYDSVVEEISREGTLSFATHWKLAQEAFVYAASYDITVANRLMQIGSEGEAVADVLPSKLLIAADRVSSLRYGENPHQIAALYDSKSDGITRSVQFHGKDLSYNNITDLDAAWELVSEFQLPAVAIIKHTTPCGCAEQETQTDAFRKALEADPISAYGGVVAFNREVETETAVEVSQLFIEAIAAPAYSQAALDILTKKKNLRLMKVTPSGRPRLVIKSVSDALLAQTSDTTLLDPSMLQVRTIRQPTPEEMRTLLFAWKVCKYVKSNAIVYARAGQILSVGGGQTSRIESVKLGATKAILPLAGAVLASDAYFPFPDSIHEAVKFGITALIQQGGSVRDSEVIAAADESDLAMVFTGIRHFRH